MHKYSREHQSDDAALPALDRLLRAEYPHEADVLSYVAVVDSRQLYRAAGYPSTPQFLIARWNVCRSSTFRRQRAARAARRFPILFEALADGRLNLTAVALLAKHFTAKNVDELIAVATRKTCEDVEQLIADRFPEKDVSFRLEAVAPPPSQPSSEGSGPAVDTDSSLAGNAQVVANPEAPVPLEALAPSAPTKVASTYVPALVRPTAPDRYALQVTISGTARATLRRAQELLGFQVRADDIAQVLELALDALVEKLEKKKCARTDRPRRVPPSRSQNPRHIPADVKRIVWQRDGGPPANAVPSAGRSSSITCSMSMMEASRLRITSSFAAAPTTSSKRNEDSGASSCATSVPRQTNAGRRQSVSGGSPEVKR